MPFFIHVTAMCSVCDAICQRQPRAKALSGDEVLQIDRWDATPDGWSFERDRYDGNERLRCSECVANQRF